MSMQQTEIEIAEQGWWVLCTHRGEPTAEDLERNEGVVDCYSGSLLALEWVPVLGWGDTDLGLGIPVRLRPERILFRGEDKPINRGESRRPRRSIGVYSGLFSTDLIWHQSHGRRLRIATEWSWVANEEDEYDEETQCPDEGDFDARVPFDVRYFGPEPAAVAL